MNFKTTYRPLYMRLPALAQPPRPWFSPDPTRNFRRLDPAMPPLFLFSGLDDAHQSAVFAPSPRAWQTVRCDDHIGKLQNRHSRVLWRVVSQSPRRRVRSNHQSLRRPNIFRASTGGAVDGFVFWTRNLEPFFDALDAVRAKNMPFVVHYTVTGYPRALDAATIRPETGDRPHPRGRERLRPRYRRLALRPHRIHLPDPARLAPAELRSSLPRNGGSGRRGGGIVRSDLSKDSAQHEGGRDRHGFRLVGSASRGQARAFNVALPTSRPSRGLRLTLCDQPDLRSEGVGEARCIDAERLGRVAGRPIDVPRRPHRKTCGCWASRDIGAYDSCPHGCAYCYAVNSRQAAKRRFGDHDPDSEFLVEAK